MGNKILVAMRGFEVPQKNDVMEKLNEQGAGIEDIVTVHTKIGVLQACSEESEIQAAIISEYLESGSPYKPDEFDEIDAIREELRVIPILMDTHRGKSYVEKLQAQAIYNAIFEEDADMAAMANLIKAGRNKKAARLYYGIHQLTDNNLGSLYNYSNPEEINSCLVHVVNGGDYEDFIARLSYVEKRLSYQDFTILLSKLPSDYLEDTKKSVEFQNYFNNVPVPHTESSNGNTAREKMPGTVEKERKSFTLFSSGKKAGSSEPAVIKEKIVPAGTMEIGVCSVSHGSGATYTAILCAHSLSREYRVAFVEQNQSGHTQCLMRGLTRNTEPNIKGGNFSYDGVDYYFGIDYLQFVTEYRNKYDFVLVDFGILEDDLQRREFCRMNKYFVLVPGVLWRREDIKEYGAWVESGNHIEGAAFLTPFSADAGLRKQINELCDSDELMVVGYASDAFEPREHHKELFYRLCGICAEEKTDTLMQKIKQKLFRCAAL